MGNGISWLHLTDLHCGSKGFADHWGSVRSKMWPDLEHLIEQLDGDLDLVLFTGDLTQMAAVNQFKMLNDFLDELWELFDRKTSRPPKLVAVPGNHDLVRPSGAVLHRSHYHDLKDSWAKPHVQAAFWKTKPVSDTRKLVRRAFANYEAWWNALGSRRLAPAHVGLLPGDHSATFKKDGIALGLLGLNSAFLQLGDGIEEGDGVLDVRVVQANAACGPDGVSKWVDAHNVCFLLTHHPATWLAEGGRTFVNDVCDGPDRFALHLFGHMHEQRSTETSVQSGEPRRMLQGASMFSLEKWVADGARKDRLVNGYSAGRLVRQGTGYAYALWPRVREKVGGGFHMIKDPTYRYESPAHEATSLRKIASRRTAADATNDVLVNSLADAFPGVAALTGPPRYADVHDFIKDWLKEYGHKVGRIRIKNIALDMQHTFPCLEHISEKSWPHGIEWRTVFIDHQQGRFARDLHNDRKVTPTMAQESELRLVDLLRDKETELPVKRVTIDARAYDDLPPMHGFLVNDSALIVGVCMLDNGRMRTTPYMIFLMNGEERNLDAETAKGMRDLFTSWFEAHWASGRRIQPGPDVAAPSEPPKASP